MVRTQIQLKEEQYRLLKDEAHRRGVSLSKLVRLCVDKALREIEPSQAARYRRAWEVVGAFTDPEGKTDWSSKHDDYLEDAAETPR